MKVTRPDGTTATQSSVLDARGVTFTYTDTKQAGIYKVAVQGSTTQDAFAVSLPEDESDLTARLLTLSRLLSRPAYPPTV